ncbi:hypothetical protein MRB53_008331 [Persea americana]|uniref:Uncharacterized protein n=1 Tax=Persea americana TaxID=3435 RepID=A0ACC2MLU5_PERAE|nr:hypothetical protein MRB53_008331 [Persea americana]
MASSSSAKTTISNAKFEVEKFDGTNNFGMWQCEDESKASGKSKQVEFDIISVKSDDDYTNEEKTPVDVILIELEGDETGEEKTPVQEPPQEEADSIAISRPKRNIRKPQRFTDMVAYALLMVEECVPTTYKKAKRHSESVE